MKKSRDLQEERKRVVREHRKAETQLVEQGKTPYFLKRGTLVSWGRVAQYECFLLVGDIKKLELAQQFEQYKVRTGDGADLDRFLEKKRRRKASKQKKYMPRPYPPGE